MPARLELGRAGLPEKPWVGRSFSRAASGYDRVAGLQRQIGERLLARLDEAHAMPKTILDVGAGTGFCTERLAQDFPEAELVALDIAEGMLRVLGERPGLRGHALRVCGDGEALPLRDASVDWVVSNVALQWCADLPAVLAGFRRVLRPGGRVLFSSFGEGTLRELRRAWAEADGHTHVNAFASLATVEGALAAAGFAEYSLHSERRVLAYPSVEALLRELKSLGARNVTHDRPRQLTGKGTFRRMLDAYAQAMPGNRIQASFEVVYVHARLADGGS